MTTLVNTGSVCLICNASCTSSRNFVNIFNKEATLSEELCLQSLLQNILEKEIKEDTVHSQILCKKCFKLLDEYDELRGRVSEIKNEIFIQYNTTLEKQSAEEPHSEENDMENNSPRILEIIEIANNADKNVPHQRNVNIKINTGLKGNNLPKKILDIPSSDEESSHEREDLEMTNYQNVVQESEEENYKVSRNVIIKNVQNIPPVFIKTEPPSEESNPPPSSSIIINKKFITKIQASPKIIIENKPNILKKKTMTISDGQVIQEVQKTETINDIIENIHITKKITDEGPPLVSREENIYTCLLCMGEETVAGEAKAIIQHIKEAHNARLYICDVCGQPFSKRTNLSAHMDEHVATEEGDFQCEVCNRIFSNLRLFRIHKRMHYPQSKTWTCETCGKRYPSRNLLEEHLNTHLGVRPYVCPTCNKDFSSKYALKSHEKTHAQRPRNFKCSSCEKSFLSHANLLQHEKTHFPTKDFYCHLCNKQFGSQHSLEIHTIVHTGYKPFICGICGKAFARKAEIKDHERTHTGERPFQCEMCGATFSQRSNLQSHKRVTHYDDKRYNCQECGKCFKRKRLLDYHLKAAHTGERPFKCDVCDASFVYPEHFKKHRRIHTGEKPFVCEVCGKAFNSRDNRNAHRFVHSDKKPYECLVCAAGFMRKPLLMQHMQLHGHINDTIVVNQPRLTNEDGTLLSIDDLSNDDTTTESKVFEVDDSNGEQHILINGKQISFVEAASENEDNHEEMLEEMEQVIAHEDDQLEDLIAGGELTETETQIIDTPDGPIQLVKVKIPNENGQEEEAWIKIVPE